MQDPDARLRVGWLTQGPDDFPIEALSFVDALANRHSAYCRGVQMQQRGHFLKHGRQTAGVMPIFHQEATRGLQIHQQRDVLREAVKVLKRQWYVQSSSNRE